MAAGRHGIFGDMRPVTGGLRLTISLDHARA